MIKSVTMQGMTDFCSTFKDALLSQSNELPKGDEPAVAVAEPTVKVNEPQTKPLPIIQMVIGLVIWTAIVFMVGSKIGGRGKISAQVRDYLQNLTMFSIFRR